MNYFTFKYFNQFIINIFLVSFLATFGAHATNHEKSYGVLSESDFNGDVPVNHEHDAETASGVSENYGFSYDAAGNVHIDSASYESFMDKEASWFDKNLPAADKKSLLEHEQLHFDISELIAKELASNAEKIKKEAETAINSDPTKKKAFKDLLDEASNLEQQITDKETEINNETDPTKKKDLEDEKKSLENELEQTTEKLVNTITENSPTYKKLKAKEQKYQDDYDEESDHSKNKAGQKKWADKIKKEVTAWQNKQTNDALSNSNNLISFDADLNLLSFNSDMLINISGNIADELVGASFLLPEFTLEGQTGFGAYIFSSHNSNAFLIDGSNNPLFTSNLHRLLYTPENNQLFGFFSDNMFSLNNSLFLNDMETLLHSTIPGLVTITLSPDLGLFNLTNGFTEDGEVAFSTSFHFSIPITEPPILTVFFAAIALVFYRRKRDTASKQLLVN